MIYRVWYATNRSPGEAPGAVQRRFAPARSPADAHDIIVALRARCQSDPRVFRFEAGLEYRAIGGWKAWHDDGGLDVMERFATAIQEVPVAVTIG